MRFFVLQDFLKNYYQNDYTFLNRRVFFVPRFLSKLTGFLLQRRVFHWAPRGFLSKRGDILNLSCHKTKQMYQTYYTFIKTKRFFVVPKFSTKRRYFAAELLLNRLDLDLTDEVFYFAEILIKTTVLSIKVFCETD